MAKRIPCVGNCGVAFHVEGTAAAGLCAVTVAVRRDAAFFGPTHPSSISVTPPSPTIWEHPTERVVRLTETLGNLSLENWAAEEGEDDAIRIMSHTLRSEWNDLSMDEKEYIFEDNLQGGGSYLDRETGSWMGPGGLTYLAGPGMVEGDVGRGKR